MKRIYLAGAVDHTHEPDHKAGWRHGDWLHGLDLVVWCPPCESRRAGESKPDWEIMQDNWIALRTADAVIALFDTQVATFGTPIEIYERVRAHPGSVFVVHRGDPGVFVRDMASVGEIVVGKSFLEARLWVEKYLASPLD